MNRFEFTNKITSLLFAMIGEGEFPIIDFVKRSTEEQQRLWKIGRDEAGNKVGKTVTNCDGVKIPSPHQSGKAMDIYFMDLDDLDQDGITKELSEAPKKGWSYWHDVWQMMGGKPMITWDACHFEG